MESQPFASFAFVQAFCAFKVGVGQPNQSIRVLCPSLTRVYCIQYDLHLEDHELRIDDAVAIGPRYRKFCRQHNIFRQICCLPSSISSSFSCSPLQSLNYLACSLLFPSSNVTPDRQASTGTDIVAKISPVAVIHPSSAYLYRYIHTIPLKTLCTAL
eukprot:02725_2